MKVFLRKTRARAVSRALFVVLAAVCASSASADAQGICVPDTLSVTAVAGKVVSQTRGAEEPLRKAVVTLSRGWAEGPVVAKRAVDEDGGFGFGNLRPGKYQLKVSVEHLKDFYLDLQVRRPHASKVRNEVIVIMGADFGRPCGGSTAELRAQKSD